MAAKLCIVNDAHEDLIADIKAYLEGFSFSPISPVLCHKVAFMINNLSQILKRKGQLTTAKFCHHLNNVILPRHKELPSALVHPATNEMPYISHTTAYNLMQHLGLKYGSLKKGFIQHHERKDVVEARHIFISKFLYLKRRMHLYRHVNVVEAKNDLEKIRVLTKETDIKLQVQRLLEELKLETVKGEQLSSLELETVEAWATDHIGGNPNNVVITSENPFVVIDGDKIDHDGGATPVFSERMTEDGITALLTTGGGETYDNDVWRVWKRSNTGTLTSFAPEGDN
jgi:hypothetical protein